MFLPNALMCSVLLIPTYLQPFILCHDKPPFIIKPVVKESRYIAENGRVVLNCEADSSPSPTFRWTLNGSPISSSSIYKVNSMNGTLTINRFSGRQTGHYQCIAENTVRGNQVAAMSSVISLVEAVIGDTSATARYTIEVNEGSFLKLTCDNQPDCSPKPHYSWHRGQNDDTEYSVKVTDRLYIDNEGSLYFTPLKKEDSGEMPHYRCGIHNTVLNKTWYGNMQRLIVTTNPEGSPSSGPKNRFNTNPAVFLRSTDAELECVFSGNPTPTVTWRDKEKRVIITNEKYKILNQHKLIIKNVEEPDAGDYYCEGRNQLGTDEVIISLDIKSEPVWIESLSYMTREQGTDAVFNCRAQTNTEDPLNVPVWFKNGVEMKTYPTEKFVFSDENRVLTVKNLNKSTDIMCLQCNVSNEIGYEFSDGCVNVVGLDKPPQIHKPNVRETRYIAHGKHTTIQCIADGSPSATYRWTFNGEKLPPETGTRSNNGTLTITVFFSWQAGNYQCIAENQIMGNTVVAMSPLVTLVVAVLGNTWETSETTYTKDEGTYVKLTCDAQPLCVPKPLYVWRHVGSTNIQSDVKVDERIFIDNEGSLHFTYLKRVDGGGFYECGMNNTVLDLTTYGNKKTLVVNELAGGPATRAPQIVFKTERVSFQRSEDAELECVFSGNPVPAITWKFKHSVITGNSDEYEIADNRRLTIKNVEETDKGAYYCKGSNPFGQQEVEILLDIKSTPVWVESLKSQTLPEGTTAVFTCKAKSNTDPLNKPVWFRNGGKFDVNSGGKFAFSDENRILTIKNLNRRTDIMCFQCNVSNSIGYVFSDGCLNIVDPISLISEPEHQQVAEKGKIINLTVIGKTDPDLNLKYRWRFKNVVYSEGEAPPHVIYNEASKQAFIDTSTLNDEEMVSILGEYHRELYNEFETKTVVISVMTKADALANVVLGQNNIVAMAAGICVAIVLIIAVAVIAFFYLRYKRKNKGSREEGTTDEAASLSAVSQPSSSKPDTSEEARPLREVQPSENNTTTAV